MDVRGISGPKPYSLGYFFVPDVWERKKLALVSEDRKFGCQSLLAVGYGKIVVENPLQDCFL